MTFSAWTVHDELIDWKAVVEKEIKDASRLAHEQDSSLPVVEGSTHSDLSEFDLKALTLDEVMWAEDQALGALSEGGEQKHNRVEAMKPFFAFRKALRSARNVFDAGDSFEGEKLSEVFERTGPDLQRELGGLALRRSMTDGAADTKKS